MTQHEVESMVSRASLARDMFLKLIEAEDRVKAKCSSASDKYVTVQFLPAPADLMAKTAVQFADALLAELAKAKEGA